MDCEDHKSDQQNRDLLEFYKSRCINKQKQLLAFSKGVNLTFLTFLEPFSITNHSIKNNDDHGDVDDKAIYMLQTFEVGNKQYTILYDTGCSTFIAKYDATQSLGARATQHHSGPISIGGVGGITTYANHGISLKRTNFPVYLFSQVKKKKKIISQSVAS